MTKETGSQRWVAVAGSASRLVAPDETVVRVDVRTVVLATPQQALAEAAAARTRLRARIAERLTEVDVTDAHITTEPEYGEVREREGADVTRRTVVVGYSGVGTLDVRAEAGRAAEIVNAVGGHADAESVAPGFRVSRALRDRTTADLEVEAMRDARRRAERLVAVEGLTAGEVLRVEAGAEPVHGAPRAGMEYARMAMVADGPALDPMDPEPVELAARVHVRFAIGA